MQADGQLLKPIMLFVLLDSNKKKKQIITLHKSYLSSSQSYSGMFSSIQGSEFA